MIINKENDIITPGGIVMNKDDLQAIRQIIQEELKPVKSQLDENAQMLRALEEASKVHKADMDNLTHQVASLSGEVNSMRKDISRIEVATAENWTDIAKLKAVK